MLRRIPGFRYLIMLWEAPFKEIGHWYVSLLRNGVMLKKLNKLEDVDWSDKSSFTVA